jgi:hypothetical protein
LIDELKDKHVNNFSPMQYRIWGELIVGGQHVSMDEAPEKTVRLLELAEELKPSPKMPCSVQSPVAQALTEAATVLSSALAPTGRAQGSKSSPVKLIENRLNLYKQLSELQALRGAGVLTQEEYN